MKNYRMKHLAFVLVTLLIFVASAFADTITFSPTNGGYSAPDGTPCATSLNCGNATPRGADYLVRDATGALLSTIHFNPNAAQIDTNLASAATINLGAITFTGALPPTAIYTFVLAAVPGLTSTPITVTGMLSFAQNLITVTTTTSSALLNFANGTSLRVFGVTTGSGAIALNVLNPVTAVPEPTTLLLLGSGLAGIAAMRRKRKKLTTS